MARGLGTNAKSQGETCSLQIVPLVLTLSIKISVSSRVTSLGYNFSTHPNGFSTVVSLADLTLLFRDSLKPTFSEWVAKLLSDMSQL